ncbi:MAG: DUF3179 domain-containing (seleno)protein [Burkholderiaceae bacterium]|nr:DUF3179 domain-containing (seleno)protein [Burkholderiaceae bacterium]
MKIRRLPQVLLAALLFGVLTGAGAAPLLNGFDLAGASVPVQAIERGGPPKDGIPAIDRPRFVGADSAALAADDRVLGIVLNGVARAYPVRILNWHEVVNDRFGERAVVVTYCPLCGTGMAFDHPVVPGTAAAAQGFGVSGLLYNSDVLLGPVNGTSRRPC